MKSADVRKAAYVWWRGMQPLTSEGEPNERADRAALARLRHMDDPRDAMTEKAVIELCHALGVAGPARYRKLEWVAAAAMVMAHVRTDDRRHPARAVGPERPDERDGANAAAMKPLRFKRLMQAREAADVARQMRRLVALADGSLDVGRLAQAILDWDEGEWGDRCRIDWTFAYYDAEKAAPAV